MFYVVVKQTMMAQSAINASVTESDNSQYGRRVHWQRRLDAVNNKQNFEDEVTIPNAQLGYKHRQFSSFHFIAPSMCSACANTRIDETTVTIGSRRLEDRGTAHTVFDGHVWIVSA